MTLLILGLLIFLGLHSLRIVAEPSRQAWVARLGENRYKGLYSLASLLGFVLICWGYSLARQEPVVLWASPRGLSHAAAALTLPAFILLVAAYVPGNGLKARLGHPMLLGTKLWALAHLLANNTLADVLLFGGFLVWAVLCFRAARQRDAAQGVQRPAGSAGKTGAVVVLGIVAWAAFAFWAHAMLMGVAPFGAR
ncbi:NnrU family protein [Ideonella sp. 4Y11]|uniref:NnrU family protein n=1 Tax=Ideonella aquatica TaxID=2824119 RepID=A0A940YP32_9BURK|nr:NnrU family protein [Ideonella aquatica]MBQ0961446.1 NnrU family protein [Ideonella aquatica]